MPPQDEEYEPGHPAPRAGLYEALNVFGRPAGRVVEVVQGEQLPQLPRGFAWRWIKSSER